ncbi:MAG: calcineurin-like phosphoesterase family protein [Pseudomonadota bacterium]
MTISYSRLTILVLATLVGFPVHAKDPDYRGTIDIVRGDQAATRASGTVFEDANRNTRLDADEKGISGVLVSNGREVVQTDADGRYSLPAYDDMNLFITKPAGFSTPVDEDMIPQFNYIHKVKGSPPLRFGGIAPTGPLPEAINFPLIPDPIGDRFQCLVFGDPQPYSNRELGFVRDTAGKMVAERDNAKTECLLFEGDVMGDDLSLYPRFKSIMAAAGVPQYFVAGNHDLDFDAARDADSLDTFRREWGPEYYSFDIGKVHFVVLDNVLYPCNGIDPHPFCAPSAKPTYNGVISERQLEWLKNDLALVPKDKLIVLNAHIPFVSFSDAGEQKHQTDNLAALYEIVGDRRVLGLSGHTHTTEQILPGESYAGWQEHTGTGPAKFHMIITGAVSAAWWSGDLNDQGIPRARQRLGSPRGYYVIDFDGTDYVDTYRTFESPSEKQMQVSFNTPRFRAWAEKLFAFAKPSDPPREEVPTVTINDLGDQNMLTLADLKEGSWVAINVWNGSKDSVVRASIDGGEPIIARRTQEGDGEAARVGVDFADPFAVAQQSTNGRMAFRSTTGGEATEGFRTWQGFQWKGPPGPFPDRMLTRQSSHLWRADLPESLPEGPHVLTVLTTDRYGRTFREVVRFEVVEKLPPLDWRFGRNFE